LSIHRGITTQLAPAGFIREISKEMVIILYSLDGLGQPGYDNPSTSGKVDIASTPGISILMRVLSGVIIV